MCVKWQSLRTSSVASEPASSHHSRAMETIVEQALEQNVLQVSSRFPIENRDLKRHASRARTIFSQWGAMKPRLPSAGGPQHGMLISQELMLEQAVKNVEDQLDTTLQALDNLDPDDLEAMRQRRLDQMKRAAAKRQEWSRKGHGEYKEIFGEKGFFAEMKGEERMVCHFYRENWPCKVRQSSCCSAHTAFLLDPSAELLVLLLH